MNVNEANQDARKKGTELRKTAKITRTRFFRKWTMIPLFVGFIVQLGFKIESWTGGPNTQAAPATSSPRIGVPVCDTQGDCYVDVGRAETSPIPIVPGRCYTLPTRGPVQRLPAASWYSEEQRSKGWEDVGVLIPTPVQSVQYRLNPGTNEVYRLHYTWRLGCLGS
jgi:hypothetical protein